MGQAVPQVSKAGSAHAGYMATTTMSSGKKAVVGLAVVGFSAVPACCQVRLSTALPYRCSLTLQLVAYYCKGHTLSPRNTTFIVGAQCPALFVFLLPKLALLLWRGISQMMSA